VSVVYGAAGALFNRVQNGETADVVILTAAQIGALAKRGSVVSDSQINVTKVGIGVGVSKGADKPDISSVEAFNRSMMKARSIAYINPARGGSAGIYIAAMFERLGYADAMKQKTKFISGPPQAAVISGEAELVITQISEIIADPKIDFVGPLPKAIQHFTQFSAGLIGNTNSRDAANALIKFLTAPAALATGQKGLSQIENLGCRSVNQNLPIDVTPGTAA
jgi:molybdate transport system substrate-binding protein